MRIDEAKVDPTIIKMKRQVNKYKKKQWKARMYRARCNYINLKRKGEQTMSVDSWDEFEQEQDLKKVEEIIQTQPNNGDGVKLSVSVRLSKNGQVAEIGASNFSDTNDLDYFKNYCRTSAEQLLETLVNTVQVKTKVDATTYTKQELPEQVGSVKTYDGQVVPSDITTSYVRKGQINVACKLINEGKLTLKEVNALNSYQDMQEMLFDRWKR